MDGYLRAASQISRLAVGDRNASASSVTYKIPRAASQMRRVDGAPMGTRGGTSVVHTFPADGHYVLKASLHYEPLGGLAGRNSMTAYDLKEQVEFSVNGERVAIFDLNTRMSETDPKNSLELRHAAGAHQGRPAARHRGVRAEARRPGRRPADAAREHAGRRQHHLGHHHAAAPARLHRAGPARRHRRVRHAEPPEDLLVPADREGAKRNRARPRSSRGCRRRRSAARRRPPICRTR